jgi:hypothetical protein
MKLIPMVVAMTLAGAAAAQEKKETIHPRAGWLLRFPVIQVGYAKSFHPPQVNKEDRTIYSQTIAYEWTGGRIGSIRATLLRDAAAVRELRKAKDGKGEKVGDFTGIRQDKKLTVFLDTDKALVLESAVGDFDVHDPARIAADFDLKECARALANPPRTDFRHTLDEFRVLKKGMAYEQVIDWVGHPVRDIGSGLMILVYPLENGEQALVGFPGPTNLQYVLHKDRDGKTKRLVE